MKSDLYLVLNSGPQNPLLIPEIVQWIYHLSERKDGCHLARTCSHLFNSLIPLVWENVDGVEQFLALIFGTKISVDADDNMQIFIAHKVLTDEDLTRLKFYAPFIKRLNSFKIEKYFRYRLCGWKQLLAGIGDSLLLPNLRALTFNTCPITTMFEQQAWLMLLLSPSLRELNLTTTSNNHPELDASVAKLFFRCVSATLLRRTDSPSSGHIPPSPSQITVISTGSANVEDVSWFTTVRDLTNLSKLAISMSTLGAGQLSIIGLLSQLESLELDFDIHREGETITSYSTLSLPGDAFPRLRHFGLTNLPDNPSFHTIWSLKPLVSRLTSVTLHFNKYRWMNVLTHDQIMSDFISPISEKSPGLVDLVIRPPEYEWNEAESSAPMFALLSRLSLTRLGFAPMMPLHLSIPYSTEKYPLLRRLELTTSWVEVADIRSLAVAFPNLDYLAVQITIYPGDFQDTETTPTFFQPIVLCVMSVFVEEDPLWDRTIMGDKLARLLYSLWPNARYTSKEGDILRSRFTLPWATTRLFN